MGISFLHILIVLVLVLLLVLGTVALLLPLRLSLSTSPVRYPHTSHLFAPIFLPLLYGFRLSRLQRPPTGNEIGKEKVKFLAIFDHLMIVCPTCNFQPSPCNSLKLCLNICLFPEHFLNLSRLIDYERSV